MNTPTPQPTQKPTDAPQSSDFDIIDSIADVVEVACDAFNIFD